jgi:hypothetical protein
MIGQLTARRLADVAQSDASAVHLASGIIQPWRLIRSSETNLVIGLLSRSGVAPVLKIVEWKDIDRIVPWSREREPDGHPMP